MTRVKDQRGSVSLMVALMTTVLMAVAAFAVDLGHQRVLRRDMQALVDMVALDLSRQLDGRTKSQIEGSSTWTRALQASVARNGDTLGDPPVVTAELGSLAVDGSFAASTLATSVPSAVRVSATTSADFVFVDGEAAATRRAVAVSDSVACFGLGSYALKLNSANSAMLDGLVGDALNLTGVGYTGLADAKIDLLSIGAELQAGTVDELLELDSLRVYDFYMAMATVLRRQGNTADADLLQSIALRLGAIPNISVSDLVDLGTAEEASLTTQMNVLDLVAGAAFVSNGNHFLEIPNLATNLGLAATTVSSLEVIEGVKLACGKRIATRAETSQVDLAVRGDLLAPPPVLGMVSTASMQLDLEVAASVGKLMEIRCGAGTTENPDGVDVLVNSELTRPKMVVHVELKSSLGLTALKFDAVISKEQNSSAATVQIRVPPSTYETAHSTGGGDIGLSGTSIQVTNTTAVDLPVATDVAVSAAIDLIVKPLISSVDTQLLNPLSDLLGLNMAGADVFGARRPVCDNPALRG